MNDNSPTPADSQKPTPWYRLHLISYLVSCAVGGALLLLNLGWAKLPWPGWPWVFDSSDRFMKTVGKDYFYESIIPCDIAACVVIILCTAVATESIFRRPWRVQMSLGEIFAVVSIVATLLAFWQVDSYMADDGYVEETGLFSAWGWAPRNDDSTLYNPIFGGKAGWTRGPGQPPVRSDVHVEYPAAPWFIIVGVMIGIASLALCALSILQLLFQTILFGEFRTSRKAAPQPEPRAEGATRAPP